MCFHYTILATYIKLRSIRVIYIKLRSIRVIYIKLRSIRVIYIKLRSIRVIYLYRESNPDDQLRRLACYPLHHRGVVSAGFEPAKQYAQDLKSCPFDRSGNPPKIFIYIFVRFIKKIIIGIIWS